MSQRPGRWSIFLVALAFVQLFGLAAILGSSESDVVRALILGTFVALCLLAMAIHIPGAPEGVRPILAAGFGIYLLAFALPSAHHGGTDYLGWDCFVQAMVWVPEAWLANPAFLVGIALVRRGHAGSAAAAGLVAFAFGALAPAHQGVTVDLGFYVWMLGMTVAIFGSALALELDKSRRPAAREVANVG